MSHQRKSLFFSSDIICAFNFIKLTPNNLKQLGKCPNKELPKRYLQMHLRIKEMFDPKLKYPNATRFSSFFYKVLFSPPQRRASQCNTEQLYQQFSRSCPQPILSIIVPKPFVGGNLLLFPCCIFWQVSLSPRQMTEQH